MPQKSAGRGTYAPVQHQQHGLLANPLAPRRGLGHHNVDLGGVPEGVSCAKYRIAGTNQYAMLPKSQIGFFGFLFWSSNAHSNQGA